MPDGIGVNANSIAKRLAIGITSGDRELKAGVRAPGIRKAGSGGGGSWSLHAVRSYGMIRPRGGGGGKAERLKGESGKRKAESGSSFAKASARREPEGISI